MSNPHFPSKPAVNMAPLWGLCRRLNDSLAALTRARLAAL